MEPLELPLGREVEVDYLSYNIDGQLTIKGKVFESISSLGIRDLHGVEFRIYWEDVKRIIIE